MTSASDQLIPPGWTDLPASELAPLLLGRTLCRRFPGGDIARWSITEVEAYDGYEDKASHAHRGPTPRNRIMFERGGRWYVYLCYGIHWLLNLTAGPEGYPGAVLIRGAGTVAGPGRLTRSLEIGKAENRLPCHPDSGLWIETRGKRKTLAAHRCTPRIGIQYAGKEWVEKPWRFVLFGSE